MHKIYLLLAVFLAPIGVFALNVDVIATPPSGTYHAPVHITLTPTQSGAKTFYSFKPDGYPGDAFLYTGSILLKHSSPLIYFSFLSTSNESKIKQNDYTIEYSSDIHFETESIFGSWQVDVVLVNSGSESVNVGFWQVQSESDMGIIPEDTVMAPWAKYSVHLNYPGQSSIVLRSPDDEERDILVPQDSSGNAEAPSPKKRNVITRIVPRKIISIGEIPANTEMTPVLSETKAPEVSLPIEQKAENTTPVPFDINQVAKASANESGQKNMNPLYLVLLWGLSFWAGTVQWYMRRRQR